MSLPLPYPPKSCVEELRKQAITTRTALSAVIAKKIQKHQLRIDRFEEFDLTLEEWLEIRQMAEEERLPDLCEIATRKIEHCLPKNQKNINKQLRAFLEHIALHLSPKDPVCKLINDLLYGASDSETAIA